MAAKPLASAGRVVTSSELRLERARRVHELGSCVLLIERGARPVHFSVRKRARRGALRCAVCGRFVAVETVAELLVRDGATRCS
jgi:hypothetical protein